MGLVDFLTYARTGNVAMAARVAQLRLRAICRRSTIPTNDTQTEVAETMHFRPSPEQQGSKFTGVSATGVADTAKTTGNGGESS